MRDALVNRLRDVALDIDFPSTTLPSSVIRQAADHIDALAARIVALEAERDKLRDALERIEEASNHYANIPTYSEGTLRYAHESTKRLARATLAETEGE